MSNIERQLPMRLPRPERHIEYRVGYPNDLLIQRIKGAVASCLELPQEDIPHILQPPKPVEADYGLPVFPLAKELGKGPKAIAQNLAERLVFPPDSMIAGVEAAGSYLNLYLDYEHYGQEVLSQVAQRRGSYGAEDIGQGEVAVVDMSSPNIAKPMSIGHLRSTVIGHAISRILEYTGYNVIKDNHLGDWGAQFGMLLKAYELWGGETPELNQPGEEVEGLLKIYVRIHDEVDRAKKSEAERIKLEVQKKGISAVDGLDQALQKALTHSGSYEKALEEAITALTPETELERAGREWFIKLEKGDPEAKKQWEWVVGLSMKEFEVVYTLLGVDFDYALGESFYSAMLPGVVEQIKQQPFVATEKGAVVANLEDKGLGKMVIQASDGRSLYVTRDLATAMFRSETFKAGRIIYVVGADQKHYFKQWFEIFKKMGYPIADKCKHVYFGMITLPEGRMSSRKGRVVFLKDVIDEGIKRASEVIASKNPALFSNEHKGNEVAKQVAIGAIIWSDIGRDMKRDILFNWNEMLSFDGYSAPYVQYSHARATRILRKAAARGITAQGEHNFTMKSQYERELLKKIADFPSAVKAASNQYNPAVIAEYVYGVAQLFNQFYRECPVLHEEDPDVRISRLRLVEATTQIIKNGLNLLGIEAPDEM